MRSRKEKRIQHVLVCLGLARAGKTRPPGKPLFYRMPQQTPEEKNAKPHDTTPRVLVQVKGSLEHSFPNWNVNGAPGGAVWTLPRDSGGNMSEIPQT